MKTLIGPVVLETKGYDVVAELEQQEDKFGVKNYILKHKHEAEDKARKYLAETPKPNYYITTGLPTDIPWGEDQEDMFSCLLCYTDDEVQRLKQLIVETWNHDIYNHLDEEQYLLLSHIYHDNKRFSHPSLVNKPLNLLYTYIQTQIQKFLSPTLISLEMHPSPLQQLKDQ